MRSSVAEKISTYTEINSMNKVILYIATSLDGFIADTQGDIDWLPQPNTPEDLEIVGYNQLMERIGTIVMGSRSYQQILTFGQWGWPDKQAYIFTSKPQSSELTCIEFTNNTPVAFVEKIRKSQSNRDIWLLGGAQLTQSFAKDGLIDEIILTIVPKKLGQGILLDLSLDHFRLIDEKPCMDGVVQKTYLRKE